MVEAPQSFIVREECEKAASQNGFRRVLGEEAGWAAFGSTTAQGTIHIAAKGMQGPWFLALDHTGVIAELGLPSADVSGPGRIRHVFDGLGALYSALHRVYELAISLPDAPLREFEERVAGLPRTTEVERLVIQRIGQDIFRTRLMDYWQGRCPLTGISDPDLLRASHIIPWSECGSDAERLDVRNGLLLSALWDAAFDAGLVSFGNDGEVIASPRLTAVAAGALNLQFGAKLSGLTEAHQENLAWHRTKYGFEIAKSVREPAGHA
jgi:hypothetical protein